MSVFVFKTNLKSKEAVRGIAPILDLHPDVFMWNVDTDDIDNVLRVETQSHIDETRIIDLLGQYGVQSEVLNY